MEFFFQRSYRGPLKAVILDWAGTTVDFGCFAPAGVFVEVFRQDCVEITIQEARLPMGLHKRDHIRTISQMPRVAQAWNAKFGQPCTEADIEQMFVNFVPMLLKIVANYSGLIPGLLPTIQEFRKRNLKIGTTTGYNNALMEIVAREAQNLGYEPDSMVCATDVPAARPYPWMCFQNAMNLGIYPMAAYVKIGDTIPDIEEGLNAGMWTIGVALSGNELGMTEAEFMALEPENLARLRQPIYERMAQAGAHYVVDSIADVPPLLDKIELRLAQGEKP